MTKEEMIHELDAYINHIIFASDCLAAYTSILDSCRKHNTEINLACGFFTITKYSLSKCLCIELSKLFVGSGDEKNMFKLINNVRSNQQLFPKQLKTTYQYADDPNCPEDVLVEAIDLENDIAQAEIQLARLKPIIDNLKGRRDKFLVHNDPEYFDGTCNPVWDFPLSMSDVQALIDFSAEFCNMLLSYLTGRVVFCQSTNAGDLEILLQKIKST